MKERLDYIVDPAGTITFFRTAQDEATLAARREPVETMDMERVAQFIQGLSDAFNVAHPLSKKASRIAALRAEADEMEGKLLSAPRPVLRPVNTDAAEILPPG